MGFFSIIASTRGAWVAGAFTILLAAFTDGLDGRVARLTASESAFGEQYDSMSDLVSFGVAPSFLIFQWALHEHGRWGWVACFLFLTCAALRLARFNTQKQSAEKRYFSGCPSPVAACTVAFAVLFYLDVQPPWWKDLYMFMIMFVLALAMISNLKYRSFKDLKLKSQQGFGYLVLLVVAFVIISTNPEMVLFPIAMLYVLSAPLIELIRTIKKLRQRRNRRFVR